MAQSYGFFDSKNGDRKYSAEDFNMYLSGLICNGIFDSYGDCFRVTANNDLTVTVGSGKAWIDGHYFVNDAPITYNLAPRIQSAVETVFAIGICCDTSENARNCTLLNARRSEVYVDSDTKKYLTIARVVVPAGATSITQNNITDYREVESKCGYVKCILGKCKVSEVIEKLNEYNVAVKIMTNKVQLLQNRLTEVEEMTGVTGVTLVSSGHCGDNVSYFLYSNGNLKLTGSGETYDYNDGNNKSPFFNNTTIKSISVGSGITSIGSYLFYRCDNLENAELPETINEIKEYAFSTNKELAIENNVGIKYINMPNSIKGIGDFAFYGTRLLDVILPSRILSGILGRNIFTRCHDLTTARIESKSTSNYMFTYCESLSNLIIANSCRTIGQGMFNECYHLETLVYEGTLAEWQNVTKKSGWIFEEQTDDGIKYHPNHIECTDGILYYNGSVWAKVV